MNKNLFLLIVSTGVIAISLSAQNIKIKGFINVDAVAVIDTSHRNYFALGQYDLFITSQVTDKVSFLGETVFEYDHGFKIGIERAIISYRLKDFFIFSAGKLYTPLGYWNNAFHHGLVLQPTVTRPKLVDENPSGGGLPLEDVGIQFNGDGITKINLGYNLMIGNGIASNPVADFNKSKSVCLNIHAEPIDNLKFYVSGYIDNVPAGTTTIQGISTTHHVGIQILNGSIAYWDGKLPFEFIGEYYNLKTVDSTITASSNGFFLYFGFKFKKINLTPYFLYEELAYNHKERLLLINSASSLALGLRFAMRPLSVIKFEYKYAETTQVGHQNSFELQWAIGF